MDASIQVGYNLAAEGPDAEAALARRQGQVRVLAAFRVLADPADDGGTDVAVAGGAVFRLTRGVALAGRRGDADRARARARMSRGARA